MNKRICLNLEERIETEKKEICKSEIFRGNLQYVETDNEHITYVFDALCKDDQGKIVIVGYYRISIENPLKLI